MAGHPDLWRSPAMARRGARPRWPAPASASTTWPTSTCTRASPARCASRSTRSGISEDDGRAVTQTGGLPYHGGPGSNYMTHSLAAMAETLRARPRLLRRDERRRHAHAEARLRRVVDATGGAGGVPDEPAPYAAADEPAPSSNHPRARPPSPPTRSCTGATVGPSGRCWSATCLAAAAATPSSRVASRVLAQAEREELSRPPGHDHTARGAERGAFGLGGSVSPD